MYIVQGMRKVKVLFVNLVNPSRQIENLYPPLGPAYLAAYVGKYLGKNRVEFGLVNSNIEEEILETKPDVVGITCVSGNYGRAKKIAKFAKKAGVGYVLIGGSHVSLCPLSLGKNMDIGVIGEGEETFLELIKFIIRGKAMTARSLSLINGLVYWDKGELRLTKPREPIRPLDEIPLPDRSLFKVDSDKAYMFSSRGCPYNCVFCASSRLWKMLRFNSAEYVLAEMKELVEKHGVRRIAFYDDLFIANRARIRKLVDLVGKTDLIGKVKFHVSARANLIDDEICALLKKMGVEGVSLGLESGSNKILKYLKGGSVTVRDNKRAVETIKKYGLYCNAAFVIGAPIDTRKTILETLSFIKKSQLDSFVVYALTPLPGTPIWDYGVKKGLLPQDFEKVDWEQIDVEYLKSRKHNVHLAKNLTRRQLYQLYLLFEVERWRRKMLRAVELLRHEPKELVFHLSNMIKGLLERRV